MSMVDASTVKADADRLRAAYDDTMRRAEQAWRQAAMSTDKRRQAALETKASDLAYRARVLTQTHAKAVKALQTLESDQ